MYHFIVDILPCSYPQDEPRQGRKRKASNPEDFGSSFLTPAVPHSPIVLASPSAEDHDKDRNWNLNNSNSLLWKTMLGLKQSTGRYSPARSSHSGSPSPIPFDRRGPIDARPVRRPLIGQLPAVGRPRSKSTADKPTRKPTAQTGRSRSKSSDQPAQLQKMAAKRPTMLDSEASNESPEAVALLPYINLAGNTNTNNSIEVSPPQFLAVPQAHFRPLPITPPRNPFEDTGHKLDPKTLKHLQLK